MLVLILGYALGNTALLCEVSINSIDTSFVFFHPHLHVCKIYLKVPILQAIALECRVKFSRW